jgi:hypothetical protein
MFPALKQNIGGRKFKGVGEMEEFDMTADNTQNELLSGWNLKSQTAIRYCVRYGGNVWRSNEIQCN